MKEPALVLHAHTLPWVSGSGINTFYSMNLLDRGRFHPALACSKGGRLEDLVKESGIDFYPIPNLVAPIHPLKDLLALFELLSLFRRLQPAIIHTHNSKAGFLGRIAARIYGRAKIVHTVHGFAFHDREPKWRQELFKLAERIAYPCADARIAIAKSLAEWSEREGIGRADEYEIVWSGIEIERFANADRAAGRKTLGVGDDVVVIGLVSKLWEGKGHRFILDAMAPFLNDRVKLAFIGEGPLMDELEALAGPHVILTGFIEDTSAVTKALDIAILPSEFEGMGRVLLEAQAAGVPVIANRVGGTKDVVANGGHLVAPGDREEWRRALGALIADPGFRAKMGRAGREFVSEQFSAVAMTRKLEKIYERLLGA